MGKKEGRIEARPSSIDSDHDWLDHDGIDAESTRECDGPSADASRLSFPGSSRCLRCKREGQNFSSSDRATVTEGAYLAAIDRTRVDNSRRRANP